MVTDHSDGKGHDDQKEREADRLRHPPEEAMNGKQFFGAAFVHGDPVKVRRS
jgi:hypothetical protein